MKVITHLSKKTVLSIICVLLLILIAIVIKTEIKQSKESWETIDKSSRELTKIGIFENNRNYVVSLKTLTGNLQEREEGVIQQSYNPFEISFDFTGSLTFQTYEQIVDRITQFSEYSVIGQDESGQYDMYMIELGDKDKPSIMIQASMHGTEWQGTQYLLSFLEQLRDDTLPDKILRERIINDFHLIAVPVVNPWGLERTTYAESKLRNTGRYNVNGVSLNSDYDEFVQAESRNTKSVMDKYQPFAFLDIHLQTITMKNNKGNYLIVGNGQHETNDIKEKFINSWSDYTGYEVTNWKGYKNLSKGLARRYMRDKSNKHTPHTLSYITEIIRPEMQSSGNILAPLTDDEIYIAGMSSIYFFLQTSLHYYSEIH